MNKKVQKQLEAAKKKLQNVQQQLAGARKQPDDPADIPRLEKEVADLLAEIHKLKAEV
jgi:cob(I)alamin adenosyltransferase